MDGISDGNNMDFQTQDPLIVQILELCKNGATKTKIVNDLAISHVQLRKALAELVDKRFLQYIEQEEKYFATHRGLLFLKRIQQ
jgi:predicted transcriptional regulator